MDKSALFVVIQFRAHGDLDSEMPVGIFDDETRACEVADEVDGFYPLNEKVDWSYHVVYDSQG